MTAEAITHMRLDPQRLSRIIRTLNEDLGPGLVSKATSDNGHFMSLEWVSYAPNHPIPTESEEVRILALATAWLSLSKYSSESALNWLERENEELDFETPIQVLRKNLFEDFDNSLEARLKEIRDLRSLKGFKD